MSVLNVHNNLLSGKVLTSVLLALTLALTGCGAGSDTKESNAQASSESADSGDQTGDAGNGSPEEDPETPAVLNMISQPSSATVAEGDDHTFVMMVEHEDPIQVTWYFNGSAVKTSSSTSYTASAAGTYDCSVTDGVSTLDCNAFTLTLTAEQFLTINSQPSNQMVSEGVDVTFAVGATGSGQLSYQWYFDNSPISGATSATYVIDSVTLADGGEYYVVVSNASDSAKSSTVELDVAANTLSDASIGWFHPTMRADDTALDFAEIDSYEIYHSETEDGSMELIDTVSASNPDRVDYTATGLTQGTHYFRMATVDTSGMRSALSDHIMVTIN